MVLHLRPLPGAEIRPLHGDPARERRELFVQRHIVNIVGCLEQQGFLANAEAWEQTVHGMLDAIAARIAEEGEASAAEDILYIQRELTRRVAHHLARRPVDGAGAA